MLLSSRRLNPVVIIFGPSERLGISIILESVRFAKNKLNYRDIARRYSNYKTYRIYECRPICDSYGVL